MVRINSKSFFFLLSFILIIHSLYAQNENIVDDIRSNGVSDIVNYNIEFRYEKKTYPFEKGSLPNIPPMTLRIPSSSFGSDGTYIYDPLTDTINPNKVFPKLWELENVDDFIFYINDEEYREVVVNRAQHEIHINCNIPEDVIVEYQIKSNIYQDKVCKENKTNKGNGLLNQSLLRRNKKLFIPDSLLPNERISIVLKKPFNYNISRAKHLSDWKEAEVEIPIYTQDDTIHLDFEMIPPFQFFYIDLTGFNNLLKIKNIVREEIVENNNDYFIYVSNTNQPLTWNTGDDIDELLTRISLMRPEPPSYYDESRYIKPYIDEMLYLETRRSVHFNFLFSQSFLNYSSLSFIQDCMGDLLSDELIDKGNIEVNLHSTTENPSYNEEIEGIRKGRNYNMNTNTIKKKANYYKL